MWGGSGAEACSGGLLHGGFEANVIVGGRLKAIFVKRMHLLRPSYCECLYSHRDGLLTDSLVSKMDGI